MDDSPIFVRKVDNELTCSGLFICKESQILKAHKIILCMRGTTALEIEKEN